MPPNSEPDEPTKVPPVGAQTPAKSQKPTDEHGTAALSPGPAKRSVRKAPVRKTTARPTGASRAPVARAKPAPPLADGSDAPARSAGAPPKPRATRPAAARATATRTAAAKTESAAKSGAARADTARARAAKAAATRAAALASSLGQTVVEPALGETPVSVPAVRQAAPTPDVETLQSDDAVPAEELPVASPAVAVRTPKKPHARSPRTSTKRSAKSALPVPEGPLTPLVLSVAGLKKSFGNTVAVSGIDLEVREGSFYGIVGPNGAGKTTTLSMITGLLRPDAGSVQVHGIDVWGSPIAAKRIIGVLPDRLRLFDRLTGAQLLYYSGVLRGLDGATVRKRSADLAAAFGLEDALNRLVADYSAGMTKKIALACAMIHSPRLLVLDEPFESVDPVSAVNVTEILQKYVASGGTVVLSSHGMDLIQRVCDHVAIIVRGAVLAAGTIDEVRGEKTLEERFIELAGGRKVAEGMEWLHSFSD